MAKQKQKMKMTSLYLKEVQIAAMQDIANRTETSYAVVVRAALDLMYLIDTHRDLDAESKDMLIQQLLKINQL